eukprot:gene39445-53328_t
MRRVRFYEPAPLLGHRRMSVASSNYLYAIVFVYKGSPSNNFQRPVDEFKRKLESESAILGIPLECISPQVALVPANLTALSNFFSWAKGLRLVHDPGTTCKREEFGGTQWGPSLPGLAIYFAEDRSSRRRCPAPADSQRRDPYPPTVVALVGSMDGSLGRLLYCGSTHVRLPREHHG